MKLPMGIVPVLIVLSVLAGLGMARLFAIPSVTLEFPASGDSGHSSSIQTTVFLVDGLQCVKSARMAGSTLEDIPGVLLFVAYASRNRAEITFDAAVTDPQAIREAMEGPAYEEETGQFLFNMYKVLEIDGSAVFR